MDFCVFFFDFLQAGEQNNTFEHVVVLCTPRLPGKTSRHTHTGKKVMQESDIDLPRDDY